MKLTHVIYVIILMMPAMFLHCAGSRALPPLFEAINKGDYATLSKDASLKQLNSDERNELLQHAEEVYKKSHEGTVYKRLPRAILPGITALVIAGFGVKALVDFIADGARLNQFLNKNAYIRQHPGATENRWAMDSNYQLITRPVPLQPVPDSSIQKMRQSRNWAALRLLACSSGILLCCYEMATGYYLDRSRYIRNYLRR